MLAYHDVAMQAEGQPVGEHFLSNGFRPPEKELRDGLGDCLANQLTQQLLQNTS